MKVNQPVAYTSSSVSQLVAQRPLLVHSLNYAGIQNPYFDSGIIVIINGSLEQVV
jgi:hypothetical protein